MEAAVLRDPVVAAHETKSGKGVTKERRIEVWGGNTRTRGCKGCRGYDVSIAAESGGYTPEVASVGKLAGRVAKAS